MDSSYYQDEDDDSNDRLPDANGQMQLIATQTAAAIAASIAVMGSLANLGALDLASLSNLALLASASANGALAGAGVAQEPEDLSVGPVALPLGASPSPLLNHGSDNGSPLLEHQGTSAGGNQIINSSASSILQPQGNHNFSLSNQLSHSLSSLNNPHLNHHNSLALNHLQLHNNNNNNNSSNSNNISSIVNTNSNNNNSLISNTNNNSAGNNSNNKNNNQTSNNQLSNLNNGASQQRARSVHQQTRHHPYHHAHHHPHHPHISLSGHHHHSSIQTQQQLLATKGFNPLAVVVGSGQQTEILTPTHLKKAKLMFFYVRYPNSSTLKECFRDVRFQKNNTAQLVKWFSNFREFYYIQMEKFARDAVADERIQCKEDIVVNYDHELINQLNNHYNKNRHIELPEVFRQVVEETLKHFFDAIKNKRDQEQSWKKAIYKLIARLDQEVPEVFKTDAFNEHLE